MHLKEELEREHERRTTEMREAARRLKDDCSHQVEMERFSFIYDCLLIIALRIARFTFKDEVWASGGGVMVVEVCVDFS